MGFSATTFVFELVNFVVLMLLLQRLVYRPLRRSLDARRAAIEARERGAADKAREAEALQATCEARAKELAALRQDAVRQAAEDAAEERARLLAQAREDAAAERARAQRLLEVERESALGWVRELSITRSTELAGRLLVGLAPEAVEEALVGLLVDELGRRGGDLRAEAARQGWEGDSAEVEVTWARLPEDAQISRLRDAITAALAVNGGRGSAAAGPVNGGRGSAAAGPSGHGAPRLVMREDASLLSGAVVRVGFHVLDASIAGQLDALRNRARELLEADAGG